MDKILYGVFCENELSTYEIDNKILSYKNLIGKNASLILCNNIAHDYEELEQESGFNEDDSLEIYQYYIINDDLAERLKEIDEVIFYHNKLDIYVLGVTHFGTSWAYVPSGLKLEYNKKDNLYHAYYEKQNNE